MSRSEPPRVAVLGGGPVGVEAALYAASLKLPVRLYERGAVGEHVRHWGHVKLFTPFGMNATPLGRAALLADAPRRELPGEGDLITGRDHLAAYLGPLAGCSLLADRVEAGTAVVAIGRKDDPRRRPFRLLLRNGGKERVEEADVVLDCTGTYATPRPLGEGGIPAVGELAVREHVAWGLPDVLGEKRTEYADRTVLVIGAGHSAASAVCLLAKLADQTPAMWVVWLARRAGSQPIRRILNDPLRERDQVAGRANSLATRGEGHVEFHAQAQLVAIERNKDSTFVVCADVGGEERTWQVDRVIACVGHLPDDTWQREMRQPEPGYFVLGVKGHGRQPGSLLRDGFAQVREAFAQITGKADLDLYRKVAAGRPLS